MRFGLSAFILALVLASSAGTVMAQSYECDLSGNNTGGLSGCPNNNGGGTNTSATALKSDGTCPSSIPGNYCGARSDHTSSVPSAILPIDAWGSCEWVDNTSNNSIFVPFRSAGEWSSFRSNLPGNVTLSPCSFPAGATETIGGTTITYGATTQRYYTPSGYPVASAILTNPPVYGYANGGSVWPATPNTYYTTVSTGPGSSSGPAIFTSASGANSVQAWPKWQAILPVPNQLAWQLTAQFGPLVTLTASDPNITSSSIASTADNRASSYPTLIVTNGDSVILTSSASGTVPSTPTSYSGTNWDGTTKPFVPPANASTNYSVTYTDGNGLSSTAKVTVSTLAPAQCGGDNGGLFTGVSTLSSGLCQSPDTASPALLSTAAGINGWSWTCTTGDGNKSNCYALQTAPQCGSVTINPDNTITDGPLCIVGTPTVTPTSANPSYACTTSYGSATSTTATCGTVAYTPPAPIVSLTASPTSITLGGSSTLTWIISGGPATACTGTSDNDTNFQNVSLSTTSNSQSVSPITTTTYSVTCSNSSGSSTKTATITVNSIYAVSVPIQCGAYTCGGGYHNYSDGASAHFCGVNETPGAGQACSSDGTEVDIATAQGLCYQAGYNYPVLFVIEDDEGGGSTQFTHTYSGGLNNISWLNPSTGSDHPYTVSQVWCSNTSPANGLQYAILNSDGSQYACQGGNQNGGSGCNNADAAQPYTFPTGNVEIPQCAAKSYSYGGETDALPIGSPTNLPAWSLGASSTPAYPANFKGTNVYWTCNGSGVWTGGPYPGTWACREIFSTGFYAPACLNGPCSQSNIPTCAHQSNQ